MIQLYPRKVSACLWDVRGVWTVQQDDLAKALQKMAVNLSTDPTVDSGAGVYNSWHALANECDRERNKRRQMLQVHMNDMERVRIRRHRLSVIWLILPIRYTHSLHTTNYSQIGTPPAST